MPTLLELQTSSDQAYADFKANPVNFSAAKNSVENALFEAGVAAKAGKVSASHSLGNLNGKYANPNLYLKLCGDILIEKGYTTDNFSFSILVNDYHINIDWSK